METSCNYPQTTHDDMPPVTSSTEKIVILVHGIRTFGGWQERLANLLHDGGDRQKIFVYKYGYFSSLAFLIPFFRMIVIRRFRKYLQRNAASWKGKTVDIVAHSFGTYVTAWALRGMEPDEAPAIRNLILCGSVLKRFFPWEDLVVHDQKVQRVINECGTKDVWPVIAQFFVLGMGIAGRQGFAGVTGRDAGILNRYYSLGHSGFFTDEFMGQQWAPILKGQGLYDITDSSAPIRSLGAWVENLLEPMKLLLVISPLLIAYSIYQKKELEISRAETVAAEARERSASDSLALLVEEQARIYAEKQAVEAQVQQQEAEQKFVDTEALKTLASTPGLTSVNPEKVLFESFRAELDSSIAPSLPVQQTALNTLLNWVLVTQDDARRWELGGWGWARDAKAKAWSQEDVPPVHSSDGEHVLIRRQDEPTDANSGRPSGGSAYLLSLDNLGLKRLEIGEDFDVLRSCYVNQTLHYAGFNQRNSEIYVTRWACIEKFSITGEPLDHFYVSATKDNISFVDTIMQDSLLIVGDIAGDVHIGENEVAEGARRQWESIGRAQYPIVRVNKNEADNALLILNRNGGLYYYRMGDRRMVEIPHEEIVTSAQFAKGTGRDAFMTTSADGRLRIWQIEEGKPKELITRTAGRYPLLYGNFSDDNQLLLAIDEAGGALFWTAQSRTPVKILQVESNPSGLSHSVKPTETTGIAELVK